MGHVRHDAILVTHWNEETIRKLRASAPGTATEPVNAPVNSYWTFAVLTCGSKFGFGAYEQFQRELDMFVEVLRSESAEWVRIEYGEDDECSRVVSDAWAPTAPSATPTRP